MAKIIVQKDRLFMLAYAAGMATQWLHHALRNNWIPKPFPKDEHHFESAFRYILVNVLREADVTELELRLVMSPKIEEMKYLFADYENKYGERLRNAVKER